MVETAHDRYARSAIRHLLAIDDVRLISVPELHVLEFGHGGDLGSSRKRNCAGVPTGAGGSGGELVEVTAALNRLVAFWGVVLQVVPMVRLVG